MRGGVGGLMRGWSWGLMRGEVGRLMRGWSWGLMRGGVGLWRWLLNFLSCSRAIPSTFSPVQEPSQGTEPPCDT